jgi:hypothetical protein
MCWPGDHCARAGRAAKLGGRQAAIAALVPLAARAALIDGVERQRAAVGDAAGLRFPVTARSRIADDIGAAPGPANCFRQQLGVVRSGRRRGTGAERVSSNAALAAIAEEPAKAAAATVGNRGRFESAAARARRGVRRSGSAGAARAPVSETRRSPSVSSVSSGRRRAIDDVGVGRRMACIGC